MELPRHQRRLLLALKFEGLGHAICQGLSGGHTVQQEVTAFYDANLAPDVGRGILTGAVSAYCPQFPTRPKWSRPGRAHD